jgi:biotin carboxylase
MSRGYASLHVQSQPEVPSVYANTFNPSDYVGNLIHEGDLAATLSELRRYDVGYVIAGSEPGVELADHLSESLNLLTNGTRLSKARRDKFEMLEVLRACGVRTAEYLKASRPSDVVEWAGERTLSKVVLKPINSAGSDNVHVCESESEIHTAFALIVGHENKFGYVNKEVLAEEYLEGVEHVVNTVSRDGFHYVAEIWRCEKRRIKGRAAHTCVYDVEKLLPFDGEDQAQLVEYTLRVLDVLRITHGPAHTEIMMTREGPVLIEIGARLMGGVNPSAFEACLGTNLVRLTADAYLSPFSFLPMCGTPYTLRKTAYAVVLISNVEGVLGALPFAERVSQLESFFDISLTVRGLSERWTCSPHRESYSLYTPTPPCWKGITTPSGCWKPTATPSNVIDGGTLPHTRARGDIRIGPSG